MPPPPEYSLLEQGADASSINEQNTTRTTIESWKTAGPSVIYAKYMSVYGKTRSCDGVTPELALTMFETKPFSMAAASGEPYENSLAILRDFDMGNRLSRKLKNWLNKTIYRSKYCEAAMTLTGYSHSEITQARTDFAAVRSAKHSRLVRNAGLGP